MLLIATRIDIACCICRMQYKKVIHPPVHKQALLILMEEAEVVSEKEKVIEIA